MRRILNVLGTIVLGLFVVSIVFNVANSLINKNDGVTAASNETTFHNSFVSGCKQTASKYQNIDVEYFCGCAYNQLNNLYPDFATNDDRLNRMIKDGYNPSETDAVATCITSQPATQTN